MDNMSKEYKQWLDAYRYVAHFVHENAKSHGFWDKPRNDGEAIALMHSELSEALESIRHDDPPSGHIPEFSGSEEEFADVIIRIMDYCEGMGMDIAGAVLAKMEYNSTRPHLHGKKF